MSSVSLLKHLSKAANTSFKLAVEGVCGPICSLSKHSTAQRLTNNKEKNTVYLQLF